MSAHEMISSGLCSVVHFGLRPGYIDLLFHYQFSLSTLFRWKWRSQPLVTSLTQTRALADCF